MDHEIERALDVLFLALALARHARTQAVRAATAELHDAEVILIGDGKGDPEKYQADWYKESNRACGNYVLFFAQDAWDRKCHEVFRTMGVNLKRISKLGGPKAAEAYGQFSEGLTTLEEFVYWLVDHLVQNADQSVLDRLRVFKP